MSPLNYIYFFLSSPLLHHVHSEVQEDYPCLGITALRQLVGSAAVTDHDNQYMIFHIYSSLKIQDFTNRYLISSSSNPSNMQFIRPRLKLRRVSVGDIQYIIAIHWETLILLTLGSDVCFSKLYYFLSPLREGVGSDPNLDQ